MSENYKAGFIRFICSAVPIMLVLYVLSIGPVIRALEGPEGIPAKYEANLEVIYAPLSWAFENSELYRRFHIQYYAIWSKYD